MEQKSSFDQKIFLPIFLLTVLLTLAFLVQPKQQLTERQAFAACISDKKVVMYGSDSCVECQMQKGMFAEDFQKIQYINCDFHQEECTQKGITKWPTWLYNGKAFVGVQTFKDLAEISACSAPEAN